MNIIGLDIGGANIKAADLNGQTVVIPFAVWKQPEKLASILIEVIGQFQPADCLAVTMTAEIADCFATKSEGVDRILSSVETAAGKLPIRVWQTGAEFVEVDVAREIPILVAAANWHAQATWLGRIVPRGKSILIDVGTTTTDIIPLVDGMPVPEGLTDRHRLQSGELVYSGVRRTPLCAIAHTVPIGHNNCPVAAELFATTLDVYLLLGDICESVDDLETANGRPATVDAAYDRLARMLCCDRNEFSQDEARQVASFFADVQKQRIGGAVQKVARRLAKNGAGEIAQVLVSGSGEFLARGVAGDQSLLADAAMTSLADIFSPTTAETACAVAVSTLASERLFV